MPRVRLTDLTPEDETPFDGPSGLSPSADGAPSGRADGVTPRVTREGARAIAERYLDHPEAGGRPVAGSGIREVLRLKEIRFRQPCIYCLPDDRLRACWIAYVARPGRPRAGNDLIVIDADTGAVLYAGPANDDE
jgi:hypothetical protein